MSLADALNDFQSSVAQCDSLIASAHRKDSAGTHLFGLIDRKQITIAAFLNMFVAWETFLEASLVRYLTGEPAIGGSLPVRYVSPPSITHALSIVIGVMRFFDYGNHENFRKVVNLYFANGVPYEPHFSGIIADLSDMRTIRNACAHISSTTQGSLETLALRITGTPHPGIGVYELLTMIDPHSPGDTIYLTYKAKLATAVQLIAT